MPIQTEKSPLPPLPAWQARSFWAAIIGVAANIAPMVGFDLFGFFGVEGEEELGDVVMHLVGAAAIVWSWIERKAPSFSLSLSGKEL